MRDLLSQVLPRSIGPTRDTQETAAKTDAQSDLRMGTVLAVTTRGITVAVGAQTHEASHLDSYAPAVGDPVALMAVQDTWLAMGRVVGAGNPTDGSAPAAGTGPSLLGGGMVTGITNASLAASAGAAVTIPKYDITYFHPENHVVLVVSGLCWTASATTATATFFTQEITLPMTPGFYRKIPNVTTDMTTTMFAVVPASLGGQLRRVIAQVSAAGGTITARDGNAAYRGFMFVLDLGDASFMVTR